MNNEDAASQMQAKGSCKEGAMHTPREHSAG